MKPTSTSITEGVDLTGKTAVVTGASSGLGREVARVLALRGARVVLACRNPGKAEAVVAEFGQAHGREVAGRCEIGRCDTASMASVGAFGQELAREGSPVDLLFLNAGVFGLPYKLTEDGFEYTYAANYVGHFALVHDIASRGGFSRRARLVATISDGAYKNPLSKFDLDLLTRAKENERGFPARLSSPNSKILLALMMGEFSRRVRGTPLAAVTFNGADPGPTKTDNVNQIGPVLGAIARLVGPLLFKTVEEGAAVLLWAATADALEGQTGKLFSHACEEVRMPAKCEDPALAASAWDATEKALALAPFAPR